VEFVQVPAAKQVGKWGRVGQFVCETFEDPDLRVDLHDAADQLFGVQIANARVGQIDRVDGEVWDGRPAELAASAHQPLAEFNRFASERLALTQVDVDDRCGAPCNLFDYERISPDVVVAFARASGNWGLQSILPRDEAHVATRGGHSWRQGWGSERHLSYLLEATKG